MLQYILLIFSNCVIYRFVAEIISCIACIFGFLAISDRTNVGRNDEQHSAKSRGAERQKGIKLTKGGLLAPAAKVLVNWRSAEKCIRMLIAKGSYLNPEEMEAYVRYRRGQICKS